MSFDGSAPAIVERSVYLPPLVRFSRSGVVAVVIDNAALMARGLAHQRLCRVGASHDLLRRWSAELDGATRPGSETWFAVACAALALSVVAGPEWPASPPDEGVMRGAILWHALGVLHRREEHAPLRLDAAGELARHRTRAAGRAREAQAAATGERSAREEAWLWLDLEETAARAAAASAIIALNLA